MKKLFYPGDLVRNKRWMGVSLWLNYAKTTFSGINCDVRAQMQGRYKFELKDLALVISIYKDHDIPEDSDIALIFYPKKQVFCYTWTCYLVTETRHD